MPATRFSRRRVLRGAVVTAALGGSATWLSCGSNSKSQSSAGNAAGANQTAAGTATRAAAGAAATGSPAAAVKRGGTAQFMQSADAVNLDHQLTQAFPAHQLASIYAQSLLRFSTTKGPLDDTVEPYLAAQWEQPDHQTFTLTLQNNVKWHNVAPVSGRALDSGDVKATISRILDPATKSPLVKIVGEFIDSIDTPTPQQITFKFKNPFSAFAYQLASSWLWIMPKEATSGGVDPATTAIGTGPFMLSKANKGSSYEFTKNPTYWRSGQPYLDSVVVNVITDPARAISAFSAGQVLVTTIDQANLDTVKRASKDVVVETYPAAVRREVDLVPRPENKPFDDLRIRQAVKAAIDQDDILTKAYQKAGAFSGIISPASPTWALPEAENRQLFGLNVATAKQMLAAAGFGNGIDMDISYTLQHGQIMADISEILVAQLAQAGIRLKVNQVEYTSYVSNLYAWNVKGMAFTPSSANFGADAHDWLYKGYAVNGLYNFSEGPQNGGWADSELQSLVTQQYQEFDQTKRVGLAQQAQRRLAAICVSLPTAAFNANDAHQAKLQGYKTHSSGTSGFYGKLLEGAWLSA